MSRRLTPTFAILAWLLACALAPGAMAQGDTAGDADRYQLLIDRNIFSSTRSARPEPRPAPREDPRPTPPVRESTPPDPGRDMVLRGMGMRGDTAVALVEDDDGTLHRLAVGDIVAGRTVTAITLDRLELEHHGDTRAIVAGQTLTGDTAARPVPSSSHNASSSDGRSPDARSLLERLRQRRQQQLGGEPDPTPEPEPEADSDFDRDAERGFNPADEDPSFDDEPHDDDRMDDEAERNDRMDDDDAAEEDGDAFESDDDFDDSEPAPDDAVEDDA